MSTIAPIYRFRHGSDEIAAATAGYLQADAGARVVVLDTAGAHWLLDVDAAGAFVRVVAGPVTAKRAVRVAEAVLAGKDHGSVALVTTTLALAIAARAIKEGAGCAG